MPEQIEYEKKYLLQSFPAEFIQNNQSKYIEQTYLAVCENSELRIRLIEDKNGDIEYTQTYKENAGAGRKEIEYNISKEVYDVLLASVPVRPLVKDRYYIEVDAFVAEIDVYHFHQAYGDLIVVEVEFESEEQMDSFIPPSWFGEEITHTKKYSNKNLWKSIQEYNQQL